MLPHTRVLRAYDKAGKAAKDAFDYLMNSSKEDLAAAIKEAERVRDLELEQSQFDCSSAAIVALETKYSAVIKSLAKGLTKAEEAYRDAVVDAVEKHGANAKAADGSDIYTPERDTLEALLDAAQAVRQEARDRADTESLAAKAKILKSTMPFINRLERAKARRQDQAKENCREAVKSAELVYKSELAHWRESYDSDRKVRLSIWQQYEDTRKTDPTAHEKAIVKLKAMT